jgi:hypothetical protein
MLSPLSSPTAACKYPDCDELARKRSRFCSPECRDAFRAEYKRDHTRRSRQAAEANELLGVGDGRSIPGQGPDARSGPTPYAKYVRQEHLGDDDVVDYTEGTRQRPVTFGGQTVLPVELRQKWTKPQADDTSWRPQGPTEYYNGVVFDRPDQSTMTRSNRREYDELGRPMPRPGWNR